MRYLHPNCVTDEDIDWLCWFTKFDEHTIQAFKDHFVSGWPANIASSKNGLDSDNFNKKLKRLEEIERHYQKRHEKGQINNLIGIRMSNILLKLSDRAKTQHGYAISLEIREVALNLKAIENAGLWTRVKWVFTGIKMESSK